MSLISSLCTIANICLPLPRKSKLSLLSNLGRIYAPWMRYSPRVEQRHVVINAAPPKTREVQQRNEVTYDARQAAALYFHSDDYHAPPMHMHSDSRHGGHAQTASLTTHAPICSQTDDAPHDALAHTPSTATTTNDNIAETRLRAQGASNNVGAEEVTNVTSNTTEQLYAILAKSSLKIRISPLPPLPSTLVPTTEEKNHGNGNQGNQDANESTVPSSSMTGTKRHERRDYWNKQLSENQHEMLTGITISLAGEVNMNGWNGGAVRQAALHWARCQYGMLALLRWPFPSSRHTTDVSDDSLQTF
ncbi:hypothetical protein BU15DRAFT_62569 [Melanogaster broomeanus]|nr:hypothetical protein BU15DRAFT_62569 [Melanogaster broomeanus]